MIDFCEATLDSDVMGCDAFPFRSFKPAGLILPFAGPYTISGNTATISTTDAVTIHQPANDPYKGTKTEVEVGTYFNTFKNTVQFVILDDSTTSATTVDALASGKYVVILDTEDGKHKAYGVIQGLKLASAVQEIYNDDVLSGWVVTMEETKVPYSAIYTAS